MVNRAISYSCSAPPTLFPLILLFASRIRILVHNHPMNTFVWTPTSHTAITGKATVKNTVQAIFLRCLLYLVHAPILNLLDSTTFAILKEEKKQLYGRTRAFGTLGFVIVSAIVSVWIQQYSADRIGPGHQHMARLPSERDQAHVNPNYLPSIITGSVAAFAAIIVSRFSTEYIQPSKQHFTRALVVSLKTPKMIKCLLMAFLFGMGNAFWLEYYFLILIQQGISYYFFGIQTFILVLGEIPTFLVSGYLIRRVGSTLCVIGSLTITLGRAVAYALVHNYWYILSVEWIGGAAFPLAYNAFLSDASEVSAMVHEQEGDVLASMQGLVVAILFGLTACLGGLVWGLLLERYTGRTVFLISAGYTFVAIMIIGLAVFLRWQIRKIRRRPARAALNITS